IVSHFNDRPPVVRSKMKSQAHTWLGCSARGRTQPLAMWPKCRFFLAFCGTFSPSRRHSRYTRLRFTAQPSRLKSDLSKKSKGASLETWTYGYDAKNELIWVEKRAT